MTVASGRPRRTMRRLAGDQASRRIPGPAPQERPGATDWTRWLQFAITALPSLTAVVALVFTYISVQQTRDQEAQTQAQAIAQNQLALNGQITDRFNAAITNLGSPTPDIRLGGIYALQRIMQDSPRDQPTVMQVLAAYLGDHTGPTTASSPAGIAGTDIQAAATVLAARDMTRDAGAVVQLYNTDLTFLELSGAHLASANFNSANLTSTDLMKADLRRAYLYGANLSHAALGNANLTDANLTNADLTLAEVAGADLSGAFLYGAKLDPAGLYDAKLDGANLTGTSMCAGTAPTDPSGNYKCTVP